RCVEPPKQSVREAARPYSPVSHESPLLVLDRGLSHQADIRAGLFSQVQDVGNYSIGSIPVASDIDLSFARLAKFLLKHGRQILYINGLGILLCAEIDVAIFVDGDHD